MTNNECLVPITRLQFAPYNLGFEDTIYFRLSATNIFGTSIVSNQGNGAIMAVEPAAPTNLLKDTELSTRDAIVFSWTPPTFEGGRVVQEYKINYD